MKSLLLINGNDPKALLNSTLYGAGGIVYDLYHAVPAENKDAARLLLQEALPFFDFGTTGVFVRVNPLEDCGAEDISVVGKGKPMAFILPKATVDNVRKADSAIAAVESAAGFAAGSIRLIPSLDNVAAVEKAADVLAASPRVMAAIFDAGAFLRELGVAEAEDDSQVLYARSKVVIACHMAGVPSYDRAYCDAKNSEGLARDAEKAKMLGFKGKMAINGVQVRLIESLFA